MSAWTEQDHKNLEDLREWLADLEDEDCAGVGLMAWACSELAELRDENKVLREFKRRVEELFRQQITCIQQDIIEANRDGYTREEATMVVWKSIMVGYAAELGISLEEGGEWKSNPEM